MLAQDKGNARGRSSRCPRAAPAAGAGAPGVEKPASCAPERARWTHQSSRSGRYLPTGTPGRGPAAPAPHWRCQRSSARGGTPSAARPPPRSSFPWAGPWFLRPTPLSPVQCRRAATDGRSRARWVQNSQRSVLYRVSPFRLRRGRNRY